MGIAEIAFGLTGLFAWRWRGYFIVTALAMVAATISVGRTIPEFSFHAFNPVTLNLSVIALCAIGWMANPNAAFAGSCLRRSPKRDC